MLNKKSLCVDVAIWSLLGFSQVAAAGDLSPAHAHFISANLARISAQPYKISNLDASRVSENIDVTPPVITSVRIQPHWVYGEGRDQIALKITASDDMSGLVGVAASLEGPSGQLVWIEGAHMPAPKEWAGALAWTPDKLVAPGVWKVNEVYAGDGNFNQVSYTAEELKAFKHTKVNVINATSDDSPPTFLSGQVLTPQVSLSRVIAGSNGHAQYIALRLVAQDINMTGQTSGVGTVSARLCVVGDRDCHYSVYLIGSGNGERTSSPIDIDVAAVLPWNQLAATYEVREVSVLDNAGNQTFLTSSAYGGNTDFTKLFTSTTVKIKP